MTDTLELPTVSAVAQATIRKFASSPLTSTPEFWECIVAAIFDAASIDAMVEEIGKLQQQLEFVKSEFFKSAVVEALTTERDRLRAQNAELREFAIAALDYIDNPLIVTHLRAILAKTEAAP